MEVRVFRLFGGLSVASSDPPPTTFTSTDVDSLSVLFAITLIQLLVLLLLPMLLLHFVLLLPMLWLHMLLLPVLRLHMVWLLLWHCWWGVCCDLLLHLLS
jgi:hypothetical protein